MRAFFVLFFFYLSVPIYVFSRVWPKEGDTLHYRIVGFSFPEEKKADQFTIEIAKGYFNTEDSFKNYVVKKVDSRTNKLVVEVPFFDEQYTWRIIYNKGLRIIGSSPFHHFSTGMISYIDTNNIRMNITLNAKKYENGYFFMDGSRALHDMHGKAVWYVPNISGAVKGNSMIRDLKLTGKNTITFMTDGEAFEINYEGDLLWKGPNGRKEKTDTIEGYHHELTRLSNGHYMVLGFEPMLRPRSQPTRDSMRQQMGRDTAAMRANARMRRYRYGTLLEYDENNNLVWMWNVAKYFANVDLSMYNKTDGTPEYDVHQNSFYFDEQNKVIYLGFRNISQVLKISYPSGEVLRAYGKKQEANGLPGNYIFCGQHSCKQSSDGYLYLFNNGCNFASPPTIVMAKEPLLPKDSLEKIWEFTCPVEQHKNIVHNVSVREGQFTSGGSVNELPGQAFLVSTCSPYSKVFIVSRDKEILWSCEPQKWNESKKEWSPLNQYRTSFIQSSQKLEQLIWNSQK